jgi:DNA-binding CsgD family transcriptional regulator
MDFTNRLQKLFTDKAKTVSQMDEYLTFCELHLEKELGITYFWVATEIGKNRIAFQTRKFDTQTDGLSGEVFDPSHPALLALSRNETISIFSESIFKTKFAPYLQMWNPETGCTAGLFIPITPKTVFVALFENTLPSELQPFIEQIGKQAVAISDDPYRSSRSILLGKLNIRQQLILEMVIRGKSNPEIATELRLANSTIAHELGLMFKLLTVENRKEIVELWNGNVSVLNKVS